MTLEIHSWLDVGRKNLSEYYRTEFHENLRNPSRDYWTKIFEDHAEAAIARVADLLQEAELQAGGCMVLSGKTPRKVKFRGGRSTRTSSSTRF